MKLTEISPNIWSNGHIRFDPAGRNNSWDIRFATALVDAPVIGYIRWNSVWREYVLYTRANHIFAHDCLADISELLKTLNDRSRKL